MMKDWVSLFADYITPNGTNVTDACLAAGKRYITQLNQVSFPTKIKVLLQIFLALTCENHKEHLIFRRMVQH